MRYSAASNKMTTHQSYRGGQQHNLELPTSQKLYQNSRKKSQSQVLLVKGEGQGDHKNHVNAVEQVERQIRTLIKMH